MKRVSLYLFIFAVTAFLFAASAAPASAAPPQQGPGEDILPGQHTVFLPAIQNTPPQVIQLAMQDDFHSQIYETNLPNACGPAALLITLDYWNVEQDLSPVIAAAQSIPPWQGGFDPYCSANPVCTSPGALIQVAQNSYGMAVDAHADWTFEDVRAALALGRPVIADVIYHLAPDGFGHFVVIYGIDVPRRRIYYHDPFDGPSLEAGWQEFSASWDGPVDRGDPLQPEGHLFWGMAVYPQPIQ